MHGVWECWAHRTKARHATLQTLLLLLVSCTRRMPALMASLLLAQRTTTRLHGQLFAALLGEYMGLGFYFDLAITLFFALLTVSCLPSDQYYTCNYKSFWSWTAACATSIPPYMNYITMTYTSFGNSARSTDGTFVASGYSVLFGSSTISTDLTTTGTFSYVYTYVPLQYIYALGVPISPPASVRFRSYPQKSHIDSVDVNRN